MRLFPFLLFALICSVVLGCGGGGGGGSASGGGDGGSGGAPSPYEGTYYASFNRSGDTSLLITVDSNNQAKVVIAHTVEG